MVPVSDLFGRYRIPYPQEVDFPTWTAIAELSLQNDLLVRRMMAVLTESDRDSSVIGPGGANIWPHETHARWRNGNDRAHG